MKFFKSKKPSASLVNSLVGPGTTISGDITFEGGLRVEGTVLGSVKGGENSILVLVKGARITGSINVPNAIIDGPIEGPLVICETLELKANAVINGDITYKSISTVQGAIINGRLIHQQWPNPPEEKFTSGTPEL